LKVLVNGDEEERYLAKTELDLKQEEAKEKTAQKLDRL
jgi:hypothetical protein